MARFDYTGRQADGAQVRGTHEAMSAEVVAGALAEQGITPVQITPARGGRAESVKLPKWLGQKKITRIELIMFCRQMYTITKAGIPLVRGVRGLAASLRHPQFSDVLLDIAARLEAGSGLSVAMARHPKVFSQLFITMISVGEATGNLDTSFQQMAFYLERDDQTRRSMKTAVRYPLFVVMALAVAITIVNIFVIPEFANMFAKFNAELPLVTRVLIGTSHVFVHYWWLLLAGLVALVVGLGVYLNSPAGGLAWGRLKLKIPVIGSIIHRASMARYTRSFSLMLGAGVPLNQALNLCARVIDNPFLYQKIDNIRRGVERGESLLQTHAQANMFSPLVIQMIAVGEESGRVEQLLMEIADYFEREVDYELKQFGVRIETLLIVLMAAFVGVLAMGIFLPMWDMYGVQQAG